MAGTPKFKAIVAVVSFETWQHIKALADDAGKTVEETAGDLLEEIAADDAAAQTGAGEFFPWSEGETAGDGR